MSSSGAQVLIILCLRGGTVHRTLHQPIGTVNDSQKHGSHAGEASKTTGSGYKSALVAGCSLLTALYIRTWSTLLSHLISTVFFYCDYRNTRMPTLHCVDCFTLLLARHLADVSCYIGPSMPSGICMEIHTKIVRKRKKKQSRDGGNPRQPHVCL